MIYVSGMILYGQNCNFPFQLTLDPRKLLLHWKINKLVNLTKHYANISMPFKNPTDGLVRCKNLFSVGISPSGLVSIWAYMILEKFVFLIFEKLFREQVKILKI